MKCECDDKDQFEGVQAEDYAREHLQQVRVDKVNWETEYVCPVTGSVWLKDFPQSHLHGGGPPRLRKISKKGERPRAS